MHVECHTVQRRSWQRDGVSRESNHHQYETRQEKQPSGREQQEQAQRSPSIAKCANVRRMCLTAVGMQRDWDFGNGFTVEARLENHFCGEFHSGAPQAEAMVRVDVETAHPTVHVVNGRMKPPSRERCQGWVAEISVEKGHGIWQNRSAA